MAFEDFHVMMFPWLAFGHMIPFLEFSKKLAGKGIQITFISTPRNIRRLPAIPPSLANRVKMVEIILPPTEGLPENYEATIDLQKPEEMQYLKKAYEGLKPQFKKLLSESSAPDLILFDFVSCWIPELAAKFGVPTGFFSVFSAATLAYTGPPVELRGFSNQRTKPEDFTLPPKWITFPSLVSHRPEHAEQTFKSLNHPDATGMSSSHRMATTLEGCDFVTVRSCMEFEGSYLDLLKKLYQKPVLPAGLLPPNFIDVKTNSPVDDSNWSNTFKWLDKKEPKTVLFVGFGSEYKMPIEQIHELACGIELSVQPFIWLLRKPEGLDSSVDLLPSGFLNRVSGRGMVCLGWAPQLQILAHPAIAGCLFHSGWGSIIESLGFGHPLILMPMVADQGLNAKLLVEKGVGFEVPRNKDGSFNREAVSNSIRVVMVEREGEPLRLTAAKMCTIFANHHLHDNYIDKFIQYTSIIRTESKGRYQPLCCLSMMVSLGFLSSTRKLKATPSILQADF